MKRDSTHERKNLWKEKNGLEIDWNMPHKALNRILQLSNKKSQEGKRKKKTRMKATSGWFDDDVYIFLFGMFFFSSKVGIFLPLLLLFKKDNAIYGETDKVAAGTNAARALRFFLSLVLLCQVHRHWWTPCCFSYLGGASKLRFSR